MQFSRFLVFIAVAGLAGCNKQVLQPAAAKQDGPVSVQTTLAKGRDVQRVVESVGTFYPMDEAIISAEIEGRAEEVKHDLGDLVPAGAVLVRINDEEQRYQVAQSEAQLRQSMERLGLKTDKERLTDVRLAPDVRRAAAELFEADQRLKRIRSLVDQNIGAKSDLDQANARQLAMKAAYDSTINQTRNLVQEVERFRAVLDLQRKKLRDTTVKAPFKAYVKERQVTVGQFLRANTPLFVLVKTDPIRLRVEIPERQAPWIKLNQTVDISVEAFQGRKFQGKIWRIAPTVDQTKRTFVAEVLVENGVGELKPGSYAKAHVPTSHTEKVTVLPQRAVYYVLGANKAFVVKDGVVESREVRLGDRFESDVEILEGIENGETVALTQLAKLDTGVKVRVNNDVPKQDSPRAKSAE
ncbi:MAG TPA: efflux RND transporter periplasmic adaptor subunit [Bryobacteraceae bacterium]|nr:efflux RND transporter periplasmic adaptor subunit [Bryobacteraceae bacterium]